MNPQLLYQEDPTISEFEATVVDMLTLPDGRKGVVLDQTYFYPTGGGQEYDTGQIGSARVVEVFKADANFPSVHVVEGEVSLGLVKAFINAERRLRHMQHHTGQHLLTQCLLRQTGLETVSANINGYSPSTLDLVGTQINKSDLEQAESLANRIIYENHLVKSYIVTPDELKSIPLRRPPKVTENIRIVEIDGYDYSPCGGTHVLQTGSIGLVKVLKAERQNDRLRIYFIAGLQAMEFFSQIYDRFNSLANQMSISWQDIPEVVSKQADQLNTLQKDFQALQQASIRVEAHQLVVKAEEYAGINLLRASFEGRPVKELRMIAEEFKRLPDLVAFLATYDGQKASLVVTCGEASGRDARRLLTNKLAQIGGKGGGDPRLAQGGGLVTADQYRFFLQKVNLD